MTDTEIDAVAMVDMIERALLGKRSEVELAVCAFLTGGHLLIEDVPGVGKTTLARAMAKAFDGEFHRIQFTSDLLPSDITGVSVWDPGQKEFRFNQGPIFSNIVLSDEINRAPPKTQSALLEAMSEKQVSVEGVPRKLPTPFMVVATQNVQEQYGTYPLPESQMDRFTMRIRLGYAPSDAERQVIGRNTLADPVAQVEPTIDGPGIDALVARVDQVRVDDAVLDYVMDVVAATRSSNLLELGVGPRGGMALHRAARAMAILQNRDFVIVDDVKRLAVPVLAHRVMPTGGGVSDSSNRLLADRIIRDIVEATEVPI